MRAIGRKWGGCNWKAPYKLQQNTGCLTLIGLSSPKSEDSIFSMMKVTLSRVLYSRSTFKSVGLQFSFCLLFPTHYLIFVSPVPLPRCLQSCAVERDGVAGEWAKAGWGRKKKKKVGLQDWGCNQLSISVSASPGFCVCVCVRAGIREGVARVLDYCSKAWVSICEHSPFPLQCYRSVNIQ